MKRSIPDRASATGEREPADVACLRPHRGDLFLRLLLDRFHLGVVGIVGLTFVAFCLVTLVINAFQGTLFPKPGLAKAVFSLDWATHWTIVPLLVPALFGLIVVVYRRIPLFIHDLLASGVLLPTGSAAAYLKDLQRRYENRVVDVVLIACALTSFAANVVVLRRQDFPDWQHMVPGRLTPAGWYFIVLFHLSVYMLMRFGYALLITYLAIRQMFRHGGPFRVELRLLHPDGCCGLRPLSQFVLRVSMLLCILGLMNAVFLCVSLYRLGSVQTFLQQVGQPLLLVAYAVLAPVAFFMPLAPAHSIMHDTKHEFLSLISRLYDRRFRDVRQRLAKGEVPDAEIGGLNSLQELYQHASSMPIWPFDFGTLARFFVTVGLPLLIPVITLIIERLLAES